MADDPLKKLIQDFEADGQRAGDEMIEKRREEKKSFWLRQLPPSAFNGDGDLSDETVAEMITRVARHDVRSGVFLCKLFVHVRGEEFARYLKEYLKR